MNGFRDDSCWVLLSSQSRHTGETFDRLARQQDDMRRWTRGLVSISYMYAVEDVIEESSRYGHGEGQP